MSLYRVRYTPRADRDLSKLKAGNREKNRSCDPHDQGIPLSVYQKNEGIKPLSPALFSQGPQRCPGPAFNPR